MITVKIKDYTVDDYISAYDYMIIKAYTNDLIDRGYQVKISFEGIKNCQNNLVFQIMLEDEFRSSGVLFDKINEYDNKVVNIFNKNCNKNKSLKNLYEEMSIVKSHESAKKTLLASYTRYNRGEKQSILLVGESGTGKTMLVDTLSKITGARLFVIDGSTISKGSSSGRINANTIRASYDKWLNSSDNKSIVFIDEFDKLSSSYDGSGEGNGAWQRGVQSELLTLVEYLQENSMVVFAGAFSGCGLREKQEKRDIGFVHNISSKEETTVDYVQKIVKYGMIEELVGRIGQIVLLDELTLDDYRSILKSDIDKDSILSEDETNTMCDKAKKSGLGVRSLKQQYNYILNDKIFEEDLFCGNNN